jgi:hypothetical protein
VPVTLEPGNMEADAVTVHSGKAILSHTISTTAKYSKCLTIQFAVDCD